MRALILLLALSPLMGCAAIAQLDAQVRDLRQDYYDQVDSYRTVPGLDPVQAGSRPGTVYDASECIGAVVNGVCHGSIMPAPTYHQTCYGQMVGGICTGAQY